jgi:hypothetical protein
LEIFGLLVKPVPRDSIERILVAQIVTAHMIAMDRFQRANAPELSGSQHARALNEAMRILEIPARLTAQLDRHRAQPSKEFGSETFELMGRERSIFVGCRFSPCSQNQKPWRA